MAFPDPSQGRGTFDATKRSIHTCGGWDQRTADRLATLAVMSRLARGDLLACLLSKIVMDTRVVDAIFMVH